MEVVARENTLFSIMVGGNETSYSGTATSATTSTSTTSQQTTSTTMAASGLLPSLGVISQSPASTPPPLPLTSTLAAAGGGGSAVAAAAIGVLADGGGDGAHVLDFGDIYFDGVSQVVRAVEIRNLSDLTLPFKLSGKLLHGWTTAMRASEVRYALTPGPQADYVKHVVVPPRRRLRVFVSLLAIWRDEADSTLRIIYHLSLSLSLVLFLFQS